MIDKDLFIEKMKTMTIWEMMKEFSISKNSIKYWIKKYGLKTRKGFYSRGLPLGRKKGTPMTDELKEYYRKKFSGSGNPFYGLKHSLKSRKKMRKPRPHIRGNKNPFKKSLNDPQKLLEHIERCKKIWKSRDKDYRRKFGLKISKSLAESKKLQNKKHHSRHISGFELTFKAGKIFCRSSWEKRFAKVLDSDENVKKFTLEEFCLPYEDKNGNKKYTRIDFFIIYVNGEKEIVEIKPKKLINYGNNVLKIKAIKEFCKKEKIKFRVLGEKGLENYEKFIFGTS